MLKSCDDSVGFPCDVVIKVGSSLNIWTDRHSLMLSSPVFKNLICDCTEFSGEFAVPETESICEVVKIGSESWVNFLKCVHPLTCGLVATSKALLEVAAIAFKYDAKGVCGEVREAFKQIPASSL
eukprot:1316329-Amorphochlora_amoeboformis.AAC.1